MFKRNATILTLAVIAGAVSAFPAFANSQRPSATPPRGWSERVGTSGSQYFLPPGASDMSVYEAIFPMQPLSGTLVQTAGTIWHAIVGSERIVDSKASLIRSKDGAPACEVLVAIVDAHNQGVYRIFVAKQYGQNVAAGELRFDNVERIREIGEPAVASLLEMAP